MASRNTPLVTETYEPKTNVETEKNAAVEHIEALVEEEHNLTVLAVCRQYPKIVWWSIYWCLTAVAWGFEMSVNSAIISVPSFRAYYGYMRDGEPVIPAAWLSAFGVVSYCGLFFGGFVCSYIADRYGRKLGLALGTNRPAFLVSKLILGVGVGFYLTLGPMTCSEFAPMVLRGLSTSGVNLGIGVGGLLSKSVTRGFGTRADEWAFRAPFTVQLLFSLILILPLYFAPESPWFLIRVGRTDQARKTLARLFDSETIADKRVTEISVTLEAEAHIQQPSYISAFKSTDRIRTLISMGAFVAQQAVGIIFVLSYAPYFFQLAGLGTADSLNFGVGISACGILGNVSAWFVVNRIGRRLLFICGVGGCSLILFIIGFLDLAHMQSAKWGQSALCVVYAYVYYLTLGAISYVLLGEVSSLALRARTTALATATQAVLGIVFQIVVPYLVNPDAANLKGKVGFIFGGTSFVATILALWYIPELKGRTYWEIDQMFITRVPPRKMGSHRLN